VIPKRNPLLSDYFIDLTGITQERVDREGIPFPRALEGFLSFAGNGPAEYSCYGGDADKIRRNCDIHGIPFPSAIRHSVDIRRNLIDRGLTKPEWFSSDLTLKLGLQKEGVSHDALCDARTVASALRYFRQQGLV
jgi:inhibitor of KinA sporulation pathway (predicted exonuclease)